jgi:glycosyltransferase involved in cell wall biosynthesis
MSNLLQLSITPLILTYNEAPNIGRTIKKLTWAKQIVIVDSYSTDETLQIIQSYPQVKLFQRKFDTHTNQWNYGLEQVDSKWVLSLDADYVLSTELVEKLQTLVNSDIDGYFIPFKYCVFGKPLKGTILPPRLALFRKSSGIYIDDGHTQLLKLNGKSSCLSTPILHDDRKSLSRWLWAQDRYMVIEVKKLLESSNVVLSWGDRLRKAKFFAPFVILIYCLIFKGGIFDGWRGIYYAFQRMFAELLLSLRLIEATLSGSENYFLNTEKSLDQHK